MGAYRSGYQFNFENKLGLHSDAAVAILDSGDEIHLDQPVSTYVRDALFAELKNSNFLVGRGDIVVTGDIHALGMSPVPGDYVYDRTTITFRIHSRTDDDLLLPLRETISDGLASNRAKRAENRRNQAGN